jgi:hypothetical protein
VPIVVAGARNAAISMVVRVFGEWSGKAVPIQTVSNSAAAGSIDQTHSAGQAARQ